MEPSLVDDLPWKLYKLIGRCYLEAKQVSKSPITALITAGQQMYHSKPMWIKSDFYFQLSLIKVPKGTAVHHKDQQHPNKPSHGCCLYHPLIRVSAHRGVEMTLSVHGDVETSLDRLDGHDSQTHRN